MKKILVTGGNGFLGKYVVKLLLQQDVSVISVVRKGTIVESSIRYHLNFSLVEVDDLFELDEFQWNELLIGVDTIIHLAWYVKHPDFWNAYENVKALSSSLRLVNAAVSSKVRRFVGVGTCAEYQSQPTPLSIDTVLDPNDLYSSSKVSLYLMLKSVAQQGLLDFAWCRLFFVYGKGEPASKLYSYIINNLNSNDPITIRNSKCVRDFIEVQEAAEQLVTCALSRYIGAANICSGNAITVEDFVGQITKSYKKNIAITFEQHGAIDTLVGVKSCFK